MPCGKRATRSYPYAPGCGVLARVIEAMRAAGGDGAGVAGGWGAHADKAARPSSNDRNFMRCGLIGIGGMIGSSVVIHRDFGARRHDVRVAPVGRAIG